MLTGDSVLDKLDRAAVDARHDRALSLRAIDGQRPTRNAQESANQTWYAVLAFKEGACIRLDLIDAYLDLMAENELLKEKLNGT